MAGPPLGGLLYNVRACTTDSSDIIIIMPIMYSLAWRISSTLCCYRRTGSVVYTRVYHLPT